MEAPTILIVDDNQDILEMLEFVLTQNKFTTLPYKYSTKALADIKNKTINPDLILLDWMMPQVDGIEFIKTLQQDLKQDIPVIMLTARGTDTDQVRALESGMHDYIQKPFSPKTLIARIKVQLRTIADKKKIDSKNEIITGDFYWERESNIFKYKNKVIYLSPIEFNIIGAFLANRDKVLNRKNIINKVWGEQVVIEDRTIDAHIKRLRNKIKAQNLDDPIVTVHGLGYQLKNS